MNRTLDICYLLVQNAVRLHSLVCLVLFVFLQLCILKLTLINMCKNFQKKKNLKNTKNVKT